MPLFSGSDEGSLMINIRNHCSQQRWQQRQSADFPVTTDLENGEKVSHCKFGDLLAEVKAVKGQTSFKFSHCVR